MNEMTFVAPTLTSRLTCACNCAYGIDKQSGKYEPPAIYHDGAGWTDGPAAISAPESGQPDGPRINACLVGRNQDGIILAFRGTLPPAWTVASLEDWWQDIVDAEPVAAPPLPGAVHSGFLAALETLWQNVVQEVQRLRAEHPSAPVLVTGHSKGGPMASIAAARLYLSEGLSIGGVTTFASPHPGDRDFVHGYPSDIEVTRYENYLDLVPFLPPTDAFFAVWKGLPTSWKKSFCDWLEPICKVLDAAGNWHYESLGKLLFVTREGTVVGSGNGQADPEYRIGQIVMALFGFESVEAMNAAARAGRDVQGSESGLQRIGAAHCIACPCSQPGKLCAGGYMTGAGGKPICPAD
ncbi:MAG: hypothetical protein GVY32_06520 [Gammaproteobacteria bacterium]|jgi:hypothetical protein|nr:hypothetical protein [Gammaproteobacteria bacterium]NBD95402.1 hypothetical protein [Gammaproteobacteria bacterium]